MKWQKYFIVLITLLLLVGSGCAKNEEQIIDVQKRVGEENNYEDFHKISDHELVQKVKEIVRDVDWEMAKVEMARPADYRFAFQFKNPNAEAKAVLYELWISPNKDKVELVIEAESKYAQLNEKDSAALFEIVTGEKLSN
ncbi:hypothetical protein [Bacillus timonensis]|uniref:hypothetical protein n=1 Tax=Bacillus timonensis TaxID=1033734 RepID=UPI0002889437|nr:hypothetical protein [Bacillus timonensis]